MHIDERLFAQLVTNASRVLVVGPVFLEQCLQISANRRRAGRVRRTEIADLTLGEMQDVLTGRFQLETLTLDLRQLPIVVDLGSEHGVDVRHLLLTLTMTTIPLVPVRSPTYSSLCK